MHVGYEVVDSQGRTIGAELAIIISYPTSASGIIVLLKMPTKYREFFPTLFVKTTDFQLVFNLEQTHVCSYQGEHGIIGSHTMMAKPIRALELHYPMIQFLIISNRPPAGFPANELNKQTNHMKKDLSCGSVLSLVWQRHLFTV